MFIKSIDVGANLLAETRLELDDPDLIIRPDLGNIGLLDNVNIPDVFTLGKEAALAHIEELKRISTFGYRIKKILS